MFPENRLLHEELNAFNRTVVKKIYVIIVAIVIWIGQTIVSQFAGFPQVDAHCIGHFVSPFEQSVG